MIRLRHLLLLTTALVAFASAPAAAGPKDGTVVGGSATIANPGSANVTVNQFSDKAIINWRLFDVGNGERVQFNQPGASSIILNRVTGGLGPSQILGTLDANGRVFVINRDGILFGPNSQVNTAGFLATTHDIRNDDFMAGRFQFNVPGRPDASIVNMGTITATNGGFAALVAPGVRNSGTISATLGSVGLASANGFSLDFYGDRLVTLGIGDSIASSVRDVATGLPLKSLVTNDGKIKANGGRVELTAVAARQVVDSVINTTGVIEANTVGTRNGMIVLGAATAATKPQPTIGQAGVKTPGAPTQTVKISGTLSAAGKKKGTKGGTIVATGENIEVSNATISAAGREGGGKVLIGGDWGGGTPTVQVDNPSARMETFTLPTASTVSVDANTRIDASATSRGNGGKVILWSDQKTTFTGTILALGGKRFGDGGFVETSGKQHLTFAGNVDTGAPNGKAGTLLLDPADYYIVSTLGSSPAGADEITASNLQTLLATQNVVIATNNSANPSGQNGDIFVNAAVNWTYTGTSGSLILSAYRNINLNAGISTDYQNIVLRADSTGTGTGTVNFGTGITATSYTGLWIYYNPSSYTAPTDFSPHLPFAGNAYMLVNTVNNLQAVQTNLAGDYALGRDIDASATASWNGFAGFVPIGDNTTPFSGKFDGLNRTITGLTINRPATDYVGLFGSVVGPGALLQNINFANATIIGRNYVGALTGSTNAPISYSSSDGIVSGAEGVGGLVGWNQASISTSYSAANVGVTGLGSGNYVGGLVGINYGAVNQSYASGTVTGNGSVGGLLGHSSCNNTTCGYANVTDSYALGAVTGLTGSSEVGGLIGYNKGWVERVYASGQVTGGTHVGGLVGWNDGGIFSKTFWDQETSGQTAGAGFGTGTGIAPLTTAQSRQQSSYVGFFDLTNTWYMVDNQTRPILRSEASTTIRNTHQLQLIALNPNATFNLGRDISFNSTYNPSDVWAPSGFVPIATFNGTLDGQNHFISNLTIAPTSGLGNIGLFGYISASGVVRNLNIDNASVTADPNNTGLGQFVGVLAGANEGRISNVIVTNSTVSNGTKQSGILAGGLVGQNQSGATIENAIVTANVTVGDAVSGSSENNAGGLAGVNRGSIAGSFAYGNIFGGNNSNLGGFVGRNEQSGTILSSVGAGTVTISPLATTQSLAGGFAGFNFGTIRDSTAAGQVTGGNPAPGFATIIGGFVGINSGTGVITNSAAASVVSGTGNVEAGGFAGTNNGQIDGSTAVGSVTGTSGTVGGFVAFNDGTITNSSAINIVTGGGFATGGFAGENSASGSITNSTASGTVTDTALDPNNPGSVGGFVGSNIGTISGSGSFSAVFGRFAGGFAGDNAGTITASRADGPVYGPSNSVVGGFVAGNDGTISQSTATGGVTAGDNSIVGGFAGVSFNTLSNVSSSGPVTGSSESYLGGLVGMNFALIQDSNSSSTVNGLGSHNYAGGLAGMNFGFIDPTQASGNVFSGPNSIVGGFVGANGAIRFPDGTQFVGTISPDSGATGTASGGSGSTVGQQIGQTYPIAGTPALPSGSCDSANGFCGGTLFNPHPGDQDHFIDDQKIISPQLAVTNQLIKDPDVTQTPDNLITTTSNAPPSGSRPRQPSSHVPSWFGPNARLGSGLPPLNETRFINNEVVLQLGNGSAEQISEIARTLGLEVLALEDFGLLGRKVYRFRITGGRSVRDIIRALEAKKFVAQAQPVYVFELSQQQPAAGNEAPPQGDASQYIVSKLRLPEVHQLATGRNVLVAVVDSTIDVKHPDLAGVIVQSFDAVGAELAPHAHGTGMAGAIASHRRLLGVAPNARLLAVQAFGTSSGGAQGTSLAIVKGLNWAVEQGARVINMSFAGPKDPILEQAIKGLRDKGVVLIAAAGNAGPKSPPLFPGADPNVIAVSATDVDDNVYKSANRGKYVAIAAPGVDVLVPAPDGGYQLTTGTSVAAAHISGVAALLLERNPALRPDEIRKIITSTATKLKARTDEVGAGLVDPYDALVKIGPKTARSH